MNRSMLAAAVGCALACGQARRGVPPPLTGRRAAPGPSALFANGGFESGNLGSWTVETFLNSGVNYPTVNGTQVPPQTVADLNLGAGGIANTSAAGPAAAPQLPNGLSSASTLRWPLYGSYSVVVNGQHDVTQLNGLFPYGANQNVNSIKQDMVVATTDVDPMDGLAHVRFVVAPVLQNPNHAVVEQPYYYLHVKNLTTGQELFNRFNYVAQAGVPWQTDANGSIEYLAWQAVDVAAPGLISVGDDVQAQVISAGCSRGGHWGEAYADAFGAFFPGVSIVARQPQFANEGSNVTAAYTVSNASASAQTNVVLTLPTPNNATFASFTPPAALSCTGIPAAGGAGTITCAVASMNPLSAVSFDVVWKANSGLTLPADMGNGSYGVKSDQQAFLLGMPATTYLTDPAAIQYADYSVSIDDGVTVTAPGQTLTYTIVVKNNGPATPQSRKGVLSAVPVVQTNSTGGLSGASWTCTAAGALAGSSSACGAASGAGLVNSTVQLVAGGSATYKVTATAGAPASGKYLNSTVSVGTSGLPAGYGDPEASNNTIGDTDLVGTPVSVTLDKDASGAGTGRVTSAPAGLSCGTSCATQTAQFVTGAQITLTAVADPGDSFAGWTAGPCQGSASPQCTFTPAAATTLAARFLPPSFAVTASSGGNGTIACSSPVFQGQSSTCTMAPATGYALSSLTDNGADVLASVVTGTTYTIANVQAAHSVAATFLKGAGAACGGAGECGSGNCVDGVCCNTACNGQCQACNVNAAGVTPGTCTTVSGAPVGTRPACTSDGSACGGSCDGANATACAYPGASTACRAASCAGGTGLLAAACNGTGTCPPSASQACNPYVCGPTACKTACAADTDCIAGDYCAAGACLPKVAQGGACTSGAQCGTGNCVDGVCCNTACSGQCNACNVTPGICTVVSGAPVGGRAACASDGSACGGACDGTTAAACAYPTAQCRGASCSAGVATLAASCTGGACPAAQTQACNPYACGAAACKTTCAADADCIASDYCAAGACLPKVAQGGACTASAQCGTGNCVDGVCCNTACNGQCQACDVAGSAGVCSAVSGAPHGARTACASDGSACGGSCDGTNTASCAYPTAQCRGASCTAGLETLAASCGGGSCPAATTLSCGAFGCGATACNNACVTDADCSATSYCSGGLCAPKLADGGACAASNACASGNCVDGVCCNSACNGQCQACDVAGSQGVCTAVTGAPHGARAACATDGTACGGSCDGASTASCVYPTAQCRGASCSNGTATLAASCSNGSCPAPQTQACSPFVCGATACNGNCTTDAQCAAADWCSGGVCVPRQANGQACTAATQCGSGSCVDGVCCNTACNGQCEACNLAGSPGTCTAVAGAPPPGRPACISDGSACGGTCDGRNAASCSYPTAQCRGASCALGTATLAASCSGGACPAPQTQACDPYVCGATACKGNCAVDADCIATDYCSAGVCVARQANGASCSAADQCQSGDCVDGFCCNAACDGQCEACDVAGLEGICSPAPAGSAPHAARAACATDGSSCGGACDGASRLACAYPTVQCRAASCAAGVATLPAACDGAGKCPALQQQACAPYLCSGAACAGNCAKDTDCAAGDYCSGGVCAPLLGQGGACSSDAQCGSGHCVDGVCCNTACAGQCEACDVAGSAGTCSPVSGPPRGGRAACATDGSACGGACDGTSSQGCAYPSGQCRAASACASGVRTLAVSCDGLGRCPSPVQETCASVAPPCRADGDCQASDYCSAGECRPRGTWVVAGAGGCASTGAAAWPLLLVLLAFAARRRKLAAVAAAAFAGAAQAQGLSTSITVDRFQPGAGAYDVLGLSSPETAADRDWHASVFADYARDPLRLVAVSPAAGEPPQVRLLRNQSMLHLGASVGLGDRFELGAVLPVALAQGSGAAPFLGGGLQNGVASSGFGDLRLLPKARLYSDELLVLGASLPVTVPTGRGDAFLSQGSFTAAPTALVELQLPVRVLANLGLLARPGQKLTNLSVGTAVTYGMGGELPFQLRSQDLAALATVQGELNLSRGGAVERPLELMAALRWTALRGLDVLAGGGPGLTDGYGTPRYRAFFSIAFNPASLSQRRILPVPLAPAPPLPIPPLVARNDPLPEPLEAAELTTEAPEPELAKLDAESGKIDPLAPVWFRLGGDELLPESRGVLNAAAGVLRAHPELTRIRVEGHTDNRGKPAYNKALSQRRAKSVTRYLISRGIEARRLDFAGFGDERPVDTNDTELGRARNRRVELVILGSPLLGLGSR